MRAEAVIFDMDGVIVDSEPLNALHQASYFQTLGIDTAKLPVKSFRGMNARSLWTVLKTDYGLPQDVDDLIVEGRASYLRFLEDLPEIPIVPGVRPFIEELELAGYGLALATSANPKRAKLFLERLELNQYFNVVVHGDDVLHGKPDPEVYLIAARRLGLAPGKCIGIEDSTAGVSAVKAAGMPCIGFDGLPDNHEDLSMADLLISDFNRVTRHVKQGRPLV